MAQEHSLWTHVALYIGSGRVCDAIATRRRGVGVAPVSYLTADGFVRLRRLPGLDRTDRRWLRRSVRQRATERYSHSKAFLAGLLNHAPEWFRQDLANLRLPISGWFCSELVNAAFIEATNTNVRSDLLPFPVPAAFSESGYFREVAAGWRIPAKR